VAIGLVLLANLAVLSYVLLRERPAVAPPTPVAAQPVAPPAAPPVAATTPATVPVPPGTTVTLPPLPAAPPQPRRPDGPTGGESGAQTGAAVVNPADFQPAQPPPPASRPRPSGTMDVRGADAALPGRADIGAGLPELRLALHAYDEDPVNRYVLLNSQRLREGEATTEGVRIERITPEGVVLSWQGRQFRMQPGE
jgi:general secretion pathway protein B